MKQWKISYSDQDGVSREMDVQFAECPSIEEAAQLVRARLFPVTAELDLNDFEGRDSAPTAKTLKTQNGVTITNISEGVAVA
ncbi:hypothetical protein [Pseudomonas sp. dw_358]|uniref:hypothetical protein n=1 Tax=Pseudomonas sp. dw_358 TaxID=2720083 RepID=UPI001BD23500|nr:hypothetical protein [Pseudomonas sp. dw_358]